MSKLLTLVRNGQTFKNLQKSIEAIDELLPKLEERLKDYNENIKKNKEDLKNKIKSEKALTEELRKEVIKFINSSIDGKNINEIKKREINSFMIIVKNTTSKTILLDVMEKVDGIFVKLDNKILRKQIDKLLVQKTKLSSGKVISGNVAEYAVKILDNILKLTNIPKSNKDKKRLSKEEKNKIIQERIDGIKDVLFNLTTETKVVDGKDVIVVKEDLSNEDLDKIQSHEISLAILDEALNDNDFTSNIMLTNIKKDISNILDEGKKSLLQEKQEDNNRFENEIEEIRKEAGRDNIDNFDEVKNIPYETLATEQEKKYGGISNSLAKLFFNPIMRNFTTVISKLIKKPSKKAKVDGIERILEDYNFSEITENKITKRWIKEIEEIKNAIFDPAIKIKGLKLGKQKKADWILSQKVEITKVFEGASRKVTLTNGVILNAYLNSKDPNLKINLEKNGYTEEVISEIEEILSPELKKYGEEIMKWYASKYNEVNEAYRKRYYHNLPFNKFYSGLINIEGSDLDNSDIFNNSAMFGSINSPSLKIRTNHNKAVLDKTVDIGISQYISQMSRFIAYADTDRRLTRLLNDNDFKKIVVLNNKSDGRAILKFIKNFQDKEVKKINKSLGSTIANRLGKNIVVATLQLKLINIPTQAVSAINGQLSLPNNLTTKERTETFLNFVKDAKYLVEYSELLKQRYDAKVSLNAFTGVDDSMMYQSGITNNERLKLMLRTIEEIQDNAIRVGLAPVQIGDFIGVLGVVPVFTAYKSRIRKENPNLSEQEVINEAMLRFEIAVNNGQQPQTKGTKSDVQRDPYLRLATNFATTPILNMNEANKAFRDLKRNKDNFLLKNKTAKKIRESLNLKEGKLGNAEPSNTTARNIKTILNYGFAQQLAYLGVRAIILGGGVKTITTGFSIIPMVVSSLFGDDDDKEELKNFTEDERDIARSVLTGGLLEIPGLPSLGKLYFDTKVLNKKQSFGKALNILIIEEFNKLTEVELDMNKTKNPIMVKKYQRQRLAILNKLFLGAPSDLVEFLSFQKVVYNNFNEEEKIKLYMGGSFFQINKEREERRGSKKLNKLLEEHFKTKK